MNWSAGKIGTINQRSAQANGLSTPSIGCVLHLPGLPGGGSKIYDRSPYGNIGTITGATWVRLPSGLWGLDFDGTDDVVDCGNDPNLDITGALTIEVWIKPTATGVAQPIVNKGGGVWWGAGHPGYELRVNANNLEMTIHDSGANTDTLTAAFTETTKYSQVVGLFDGDYLRIYIDSVAQTPKDTALTSIGASGDSLLIADSSLAQYFGGKIALVRIYNRALSALEIQNHFNREKHLFGVW